MKIETNLFLMSPTHQVWERLVNLYGYNNWHPNYRFNFNDLMEPTQLTMFVPGLRKSLRTSVEVTALGKPEVLGWRFRILGLIKCEERYELSATGSGTRVRHILELHGLPRTSLAVCLIALIQRCHWSQDAALAEALKTDGRRGRQFASQRPSVVFGRKKTTTNDEATEMALRIRARAMRAC